MILHSSKGFRKSYEKLAEKLQRHYRARIDLFVSDPFHPLLNNRQLQAEYAGCRSLNITGNYRAIFYYESYDTVRFIAIGTHSELFGS